MRRFQASKIHEYGQKASAPGFPTNFSDNPKSDLPTVGTTSKNTGGCDVTSGLSSKYPQLWTESISAAYQYTFSVLNITFNITPCFRMILRIVTALLIKLVYAEPL